MAKVKLDYMSLSMRVEGNDDMVRERFLFAEPKERKTDPHERTQNILYHHPHLLPQR